MSYPVPPKEQLAADYANNTIHALTEKYGVTRHTINRWLWQYGIPSRSTGRRTQRHPAPPRVQATEPPAASPRLDNDDLAFYNRPTSNPCAPKPGRPLPARRATQFNPPVKDATMPAKHPTINFDDDEYTIPGELLDLPTQRVLEPYLTTHWQGCYASGPKHYQCALTEINRLRQQIDRVKTVLSDLRAPDATGA